MAELRLKKLTLDNFKGVRHGEYKFTKRTVVKGENGSGKTTIATAWLWLMANVDIELKSNPPVFPLGIEECTPTVSADIVIDGKPIRLVKAQTRKVSKPDANGISKVALSNSYTINDVPKSERDFTSYLADCGIDLTVFAMLSHSSTFLGMKKDDMRKVLAGMSDNSMSDLALAQKNGMNEALISMLSQDYKLDEITAMQNATLRRIAQDYGKSGEIIRAKIEGLELAKVTLPIDEIEKNKTAIECEIEKLTEEHTDVLNTKTEIAKLDSEIMNLRFRLGDITREQADKDSKATAEATNELFRLQGNLREYENLKERCERNYKNILIRMDDCQNRVRELTDVNERLATKQMDESKLSCPTCKRRYSESKIQSIKNSFEFEKNNEIDSNNNLILGLKEQLHDLGIEAEEAKNSLAEIIKNTTETHKKIAEAQEIIKNSTVSTDVRTLPEYIATQTYIQEHEKKRYDLNESFIARNTELLTAISEKNAELRKVNDELASIKNNTAIDERIKELREQQANYEQQKADAEAMLYYVSELEKVKNGYVENSANSNFELIRFKLFDYLKNGSYVNTCIPMVGDKELFTSCNTALQMIARVDVLNGLQKFYGQKLPIFVDGAESLDDTSRLRVLSDAQVILLAVDDCKLEIINEDD